LNKEDDMETEQPSWTDAPETLGQKTENQKKAEDSREIRLMENMPNLEQGILDCDNWPFQCCCPNGSMGIPVDFGTGCSCFDDETNTSEEFPITVGFLNKEDDMETEQPSWTDAPARGTHKLGQCKCPDGSWGMLVGPADTQDDDPSDGCACSVQPTYSKQQISTADTWKQLMENLGFSNEEDDMEMEQPPWTNTHGAETARVDHVGLPNGEDDMEMKQPFWAKTHGAEQLGQESKNQENASKQKKLMERIKAMEDMAARKRDITPSQRKQRSKKNKREIAERASRKERQRGRKAARGELQKKRKTDREERSRGRNTHRGERQKGRNTPRKERTSREGRTPRKERNPRDEHSRGRNTAIEERSIERNTAREERPNGRDSSMRQWLPTQHEQ